MAQYLKDEVQQRISRAALETFARSGYPNASVAAIARAAGISTGNVYRYYENKEALFHAVLPAAFVTRLRTLLRRRSAALAGVEDYRTLPEDAEYSVLSRETLDFAVENRLRLVILLVRADGTPYEGAAAEIAAELMELAVSHFRELNPALELDRAMRFGLAEIYRNFVATLGRILEHFQDGGQVRDALESVSRYHRVGLKSFFA
ncbi:MAG TPA: TetR/AcrR family transcriptional regulator [Longimicrobiaceae bacterium]|nr:TetR/AcrR family transcriptional regulator [Longimicrobiaceae bacterium]